jgi:hypothetical protein
MGKVYDNTFSMERESNQQQVQKNKRILLVDCPSYTIIGSPISQHYFYTRISHYC